MLSHALQASFADASEQRSTDRRLLRLEALAATPSGQGGIHIHNLSRTGMLAESPDEIAVGTGIEVEMPGGARHRAEVVWRDAGLFGCRFTKPLSQATLSAALLRAAPLAAPGKPAATIAPIDALRRLREHWNYEGSPAGTAEPVPPLGKRLWVIGGLAIACWALPIAGLAWMFA